MAFVYEIIKDAFREANLIAITQSPTAEEQAEALRLLNRFVRSIFGNEAGDQLTSYPVGENGVTTPNSLTTYIFTGKEYIPLNAQVVANLSAPTTLNLHPNPEDGSRVSVIDASGNFATNPLTLSGNGRLVGTSSSLVLNTSSTKRQWFYRADTGAWVEVSDLTLSDSLPFPLEFEDLFVIGLAIRLNPRNGVSVDEQSIMNFKRMKNIFRSRYSQSEEKLAEDGLLRLTSNVARRSTPSSL